MVQDKTHATCSSCVAMTVIFLYAFLLKDTESVQLDSICKVLQGIGQFCWNRLHASMQLVHYMF